MSIDPANMLPPKYDDALPSDYDPGFTADINKKMRVPDRITPAEGGDDSLLRTSENWAAHSAATMNIPDKIVVVGQEGIMGMKNEPHLHLDLDFNQPADDRQYVGLQTPPRVLTVEDRFPGVEDSMVEKNDTSEWKHPLNNVSATKTDMSLPNGYKYNTSVQRSSDSLTLEASMSTPGDGLLIQDDQADDIAILRRQMAKLSRHVMRLEEENAKRSNRELFFLYPVVISIVLFKVGKWFLNIR